MEIEQVENSDRMDKTVEEALVPEKWQLEEGKFVPGKIHELKAIKFWSEELLANDWILETLKNGYLLPIVKQPPISYEEDNNSSAKKDMVFVCETVWKWTAQGIVKIVRQKPDFVSPLTVVSRTNVEGITKKRLCWDGSRCINKLLQKQKVVLAHLNRALEVTEEGDIQFKYYLKMPITTLGLQIHIRGFSVQNLWTKQVKINTLCSAICPLDWLQPCTQ